MKLTRREFTSAAGTSALWPWLGAPGLSAVTGRTPVLASLQDDALKHDRWLTGERFSVFEYKENNCWHPQLVRTRKGDLLMSVIVGWRGWTMVLRSQDGGKTWSKPFSETGRHLNQVSGDFDIEGGGGWGLAVLKSGRLVMSYLDISPWTRMPQWPPASEPRKTGMWPDKGLRPWAWKPGETQMQLKAAYSDDEGKRWVLTKPMDLSPWIGAIPHGSGPIFEVGDTVYMPVWAWLSKDEWGNCGLLESKDGGVTWKPGAIIARGDKSRKTEYREVCVQVLPNGEWLAICRANHPIGSGVFNVSMDTARSRDRGKTWSEPLPTFVALGYPRMLLLPDGGLMAYGSFGEGIRNLFSYNLGETWMFEHTLYHRDQRDGYGNLDCGSASAVVLGNERILLTYYATREKSTNWGWVNPQNRVEGVWLRRLPWNAPEVVVG